MKKYLWLICLIPGLLFANPANFTAGKDYKVMTTPIKTDSSNVQVTEFFSYGCPWCARLEPTIGKWATTKPNNVEFKRIPVTFEANWDNYARAYYTAKGLKLEEKISPALFKAIHEEHQRLRTQAALRSFFQPYGVSAQAFDDLFERTPSIDLQVKQSNQTMQQYNVMAVPTVVVDGKYQVDMAMANGDNERFLSILNYLVHKSAQEKATKA